MKMIKTLDGQAYRYPNEYFYKHAKIRKIKGKPTGCSNPYCKNEHAKRYEWALIRGREYSLIPEDYISLCPSCHRQYDHGKEFINMKAWKPRNYPKRPWPKKRCTAMDKINMEIAEEIRAKAGIIPQKELSVMYGIGQQQISNIVNNRAWKRI